MNDTAKQVARSIYSDGYLYDLYEQGALQDYRTLDEDIALYAKFAREQGGKVLELGCGTGRVAIFLANQGIPIVGLDRADSMLSVAKEKSSKVTWIKGEMSNFNLEDKFGLIIVPYNGFLHLLTLQDAQTCLHCVKKHLEPTGKLVLDIVHPTPEYLFKLCMFPDKAVASVFANPKGDGFVIASRTREYIAKEQVVVLKHLFKYQDSPNEIVESELFKVYFPQEIKMLFDYCNLTIETIFGDYDLSPFENNSPHQIIIAS